MTQTMIQLLSSDRKAYNLVMGAVRSNRKTFFASALDQDRSLALAIETLVDEHFFTGKHPSTFADSFLQTALGHVDFQQVARYFLIHSEG